MHAARCVLLIRGPYCTLSPRSSWIPVLRRTAEEALRRARDTNPDAAPHVIVSPARPLRHVSQGVLFSGHFTLFSNISIVCCRRNPPQDRRGKRSVNARGLRISGKSAGFRGFLVGIDGPGRGSGNIGEIDVVEDCSGAGGHRRGGRVGDDKPRRRGQMWSASGVTTRRERSW